MKLTDLGEFPLIARLAKRAGGDGARVIRGIGDDCAVLDAGAAGRVLLLTTDLLTEGVHFDRRTAAPRLLGRKALAANLSDIAAMGGAPTFFTVSLAAPPDTEFDWVDALYEGLQERAAASGALLVGGDTSSSNAGITISIALLGECQTDRVCYRKGARPGDGVFVTGWPGESAAGLALLEAEAAGGGAGGASETDLARLRARHLDPEPRLAAGRRLAEGRLATALIDLSDGLAADLERLTEASGVGARVEGARVPLSPPLRKGAEALSLDPLRLALAGGEDYELLFTAPDEVSAERLAEALGLPVHRVGVVTPPGTGLVLLDAAGEPLALSRRGHEHFRSGPAGR